MIRLDDSARWFGQKIRQMICALFLFSVDCHSRSPRLAVSSSLVVFLSNKHDYEVHGYERWLSVRWTGCLDKLFAATICLLVRTAEEWRATGEDGIARRTTASSVKILHASRAPSRFRHLVTLRRSGWVNKLNPPFCDLSLLEHTASSKHLRSALNRCLMQEASKMLFDRMGIGSGLPLPELSARTSSENSQWELPGNFQWEPWGTSSKNHQELPTKTTRSASGSWETLRRRATQFFYRLTNRSLWELFELPRQQFKTGCPKTNSRVFESQTDRIVRI